MDQTEKVIIEIPQSVNTVAIYSNAFQVFRSDYFTLTEVKAPLLILAKEKPKWMDAEYNLIPRGAFKLTPGEIREIKKYLVINGKTDHVEGWIVLERTNEYSNNTPIFKVTNKEPEAYTTILRWSELESCEDIRVNSIKNAIWHTIACVPQRNSNGDDDEEDDDTEKLEYTVYVGLVMPTDKAVEVDYETERGRYIWRFSWSEQGYFEKVYPYEDVKPDEII